jgi:phosphoribosyl 1,2-cyclic phosphodiesterase
MQLWTLASGSSGNSFLLESEGTRLLVECGRPINDILSYLAHCRVDPSDLDGIVLTHAHSDHVRSAREVSDTYQVPIYASVGTLGCAALRSSPLGRPVEAGRPFIVGEVEIRPFAVPHDCYEPLGFRFESTTGRVCITTDLGWVPDSAQSHFQDLDVLVLEANYDPHMLHAGRYPAFLKRRVAGAHGHLSNSDAGEAIAACADRSPRSVWLAHLSENNNTARRALETVSSILRARGLGHVQVQATRHRTPSLYWNSAPPIQQLTLW